MMNWKLMPVDWTDEVAEAMAEAYRDNCDKEVVKNFLHLRPMYEAALSAAPTHPDLPEFIRQRVQRELGAAKDPKGMSLHSGKVTLEICDVERMLISAAPTPPEQEILRVIDERDQYHEWADKLADAIAERFGVEIGEHSSLNSPWTNALEFIEATPPEIEPVGFIRDDVIQALKNGKTVTTALFPKPDELDDATIPFYASPPPADDELRKAAKEFVQWYDRLEPGDSIHAITLMHNLRAALDKGKS